MYQFTSPLKLKSAKLKSKKIYLSIRNSQKTQLKSVNTRLRFFFRRLLQVWQWRRNRKVFRIWRQMRYTQPYSVNRLSRIYQRSNFRLNKVFTKYLNWRLNTFFNSQKISTLSWRQSKLQNVFKALYAPMNRDIGNILMLHGVLRNQCLFNRGVAANTIKSDGKQIVSVLSSNSSIITGKVNLTPLAKYKGLNQETSQLLNVVLQNNCSQSFYLKYNPRLQRGLNSYYLLRSI